MPADRPAVTDDAILGGRLRLLQPRRGHRFGHDAVLLAASVPAKAKEHAVEFGSGVGAASLALLARVRSVRVTMIEIDPALADLAAQNIARNGFAASARAIVLDAGAAAHRPSPDRMKSRAHMASARLLTRWVAAATRLLPANGTLTVIWRADGLPSVLDALAKQYGSVSILPVYGKDGGAAIRVIVSAVKGGRAPLVLAAPLVLNGKDNRPTAEAERVMRDLAPLASAALKA
jgi:tRNA1(Val) A37 N6-methylase TrmN6